MDGIVNISDMVPFLAFAVAAIIVAFFLAQQEKRPHGSIIFVYFAAVFVGGIAAATAAGIQHFLLDLTAAESIKAMIVFVSIILIFAAGIIGRKLNKK